MFAKGLLVAYVVVVVIVAVWMARQDGDGETTREEEHSMIVPIPWPTPVDVTVPALPAMGIWTLAYDFVPAGALIKLEADGKWSYSSGLESGPDGDLGAVLTAAQAIAPKAPVGALLAKIGGSTASIVDGTIYTVGSRAVIQVKANAGGPLYLTINDHLTGLSDNKSSISVKVSVYLLPKKEPPPDDDDQEGTDKPDAGK